DDLRRRDPRTLGMLADLLGARRLVDTEGAERSVGLLDDIGADPADVRRHLLVAHLLRSCRRKLEFLRRPPAAGPANHVQVHREPPCLVSTIVRAWSIRTVALSCPGMDGRPPQAPH